MIASEPIEDDVLYIPVQIKKNIFKCPKCACMQRIDKDDQEILEIKKHYEGLIIKIQESYKR